jgi:hypothetical protein
VLNVICGSSPYDLASAGQDEPRRGMVVVSIASHVDVICFP